MKVYQMGRGRLRRYAQEVSETPEEAMSMYIDVTRETRFRRTDLHAYGIGDSDIESMLESGFLKEIEVGRKEALRIAAIHKMRYDPAYKKLILGNMKKARQVYIGPERRREIIKTARERKKEQIERRRKALLERVIIPNFGSADETGNYLAPEEISIQDVVDVLDRYPRVRSMYSYSIYYSVMYDINALGIRVAYVGDTLSRRLKKRFREDPELLKKARDRAALATQVRLRLYEECPEKAEAGYRASARTRKNKMKEDQVFREETLSRLQRGTSALWQKYRTNKEFRERFKKKQLAGLEKGHRTMQKRIERRLRALEGIIDNVFGSPRNLTLNELIEYIEQRRHLFMRTYYPEGISRTLMKRDLAELRKDVWLVDRWL